MYVCHNMMEATEEDSSWNILLNVWFVLTYTDEGIQFRNISAWKNVIFWCSQQSHAIKLAFWCMYIHIYIYIYIYIYKLGFTPCKAEEPLQGMELQEKNSKRLKNTVNLLKKTLQIKGVC